ncbi:MAG TPA: hypothetical protein VGJ71_00315 [Candidatus Limnocylindrales bacterium]
MPSAVVWINRRQAVVAAISHDGRLRTCEITRGWLPEAGYLATVIRVIGDPQRVMILGPGSVRLALERAYVACQRHPDRLVDVEPAGATSADDLVGRVRALAARPQA